MSVGHRAAGLEKIPSTEIERVLRDPRIVARLKQRPTVDTSYDIPYIAGYSKNGRTVYVDRHFPLKHLAVGKTILNVLPFLLIHETVEKAVIDILKKHYLYAHTIGTYAEEKAVKAAGIDVPTYEKGYAPYIKRDEAERVKRVPRDLDLTPYIDSHDRKVLNHLRPLMATAGS